MSVTINNVIYSINGSVATVSGVVTKTLTSYTIEASVSFAGSTVPVTSIGDSCFQSCVNLVTINIPSSVTYIGSSCFNECYKINNITIPNSVTAIGSRIFENCVGLSSITIPNSVTSISNYCFQNCTGLTSITIPNGVTSIGISCFQNCTRLTSITIPNGVTSIGNFCFQSCTSLTSITIQASDSALSIGGFCFANCTSLTSITISDSVNALYLGDNCFLSCTSLISVTIPSRVTTIPSSCFQNCTSLTSITIPSSVTSIGTSCFQSCASLITVSIENQSTCTVETSSFTYVSANLKSSITFYNTTKASQLTYKWSTIKNYYYNVVYNPNSITMAPTITNFSIPTKIYGDPSFTITQPTSNSPGSFSYSSSNLSVATINGNTVTIVGAGSSIITAIQQATVNYTSGTIQTIFQVNQANPTITNFSISPETLGNAPFQINQPTSNSPGAFSYTSSNLSVATISGNTVIIVGAGSSVITATQAETANYTEGIATTTFTVYENTPQTPAIITTGDELEYFLQTDAEYAKISENVTITSDIVVSSSKRLISDKNVTITKK